MGRWPPDARDTIYRGPYPIHNLHQARGVLIRCLEDEGDPALPSLLRKIGIDLPNQCVIPSPLLPIAQLSSAFPIVNSRSPSNFSRISPDQGAMSFRYTSPQMCTTPRRAFLLETPRPHLLFTPVKQQLHSHRFQQTPIKFTPDNRLFTRGAGDNTVRMESPMGNMHRYSNGFLGVRSHEEMQSTYYSNFSAGDNQTGRTFDQSNHGVVNKSLMDEDSSVFRSSEQVATIRSLHEVDISSETLKQILATKSSLVDEDSSSNKEKDSKATTIHNVVDVNISSDTLKQILAAVGQAHQNHVVPQCAGSNQALVDHSEKVADGENESQVSHATDLNGHNTLHGEIRSREYGEAFMTHQPSETQKSNSSGNNLNSERTNNIDIDSNTNSETLGVHRNNGGHTLIENVLPMFKCDYCRFTTQHLNDLRLHLADSNHLSGSEYVATQAKPYQSELLYTERMMAVKNPVQTRKNNTIIACPECRKTFGDIFMCSQHFKYEHKSTSGYYVICPVIHSVFIPLELGPTCSTCQDRFVSWQALCDHWMDFPNHSPLPASPSNRQIFHQFVCPTCGCTFSENFVEAVMQFEMHFQDVHRSEANCKTRLVGIETRQVMLPMRKEKQHDFNPDFTSNGIRDEMCVLKQLCASGKLTSGRIAAEARINELQFQLSAS